MSVSTVQSIVLQTVSLSNDSGGRQVPRSDSSERCILLAQTEKKEESNPSVDDRAELSDMIKDDVVGVGNKISDEHFNDHLTRFIGTFQDPSEAINGLKNLIRDAGCNSDTDYGIKQILRRIRKMGGITQDDLPMLENIMRATHRYGDNSEIRIAFIDLGEKSIPTLVKMLRDDGIENKHTVISTLEMIVKDASDDVLDSCIEYLQAKIKGTISIDDRDAIFDAVDIILRSGKRATKALPVLFEYQKQWKDSWAVLEMAEKIGQIDMPDLRPVRELLTSGGDGRMCALRMISGMKTQTDETRSIIDANISYQEPLTRAEAIKALLMTRSSSANDLQKAIGAMSEILNKINIYGGREYYWLVPELADIIVDIAKSDVNGRQDTNKLIDDFEYLINNAKDMEMFGLTDAQYMSMSEQNGKSMKGDAHELYNKPGVLSAIKDMDDMFAAGNVPANVFMSMMILLASSKGNSREKGWRTWACDGYGAKKSLINLYELCKISRSARLLMLSGKLNLPGMTKATYTWTEQLTGKKAESEIRLNDIAASKEDVAFLDQCASLKDPEISEAAKKVLSSLQGH